MRFSRLRKLAWSCSLIAAAFCLSAPVLLALDGSALPTLLQPLYLTLSALDASICKELCEALANLARILGTGAALTLLASAADRRIGSVNARDVLKTHYPALRFSYMLFFVLVFAASFTGDCSMGAAALLTTVGAVLLSVWFFRLSLILFLDSERQSDMIFGYYETHICRPGVSKSEQMLLLLDAVSLTRHMPTCFKKLDRVLRAVISAFAVQDEDAKKAAEKDDWTEVPLLSGLEYLKIAWSGLQKNEGADAGTYGLQADIIRRDMLTDTSWKKQRASHLMLLAGAVYSLLPWKTGSTYVEACAKLEDLCGALRADENRGDSWTEQIISELACAFGMVMAVSLVNQSKPSWVHQEDLEEAWTRYASSFRSSLFAAMEEDREDRRSDLDTLLEHMEWIARKDFDISWSEYSSDCVKALADGDAGTAEQVAKLMSNRYLLDRLISRYTRT